MGTGNRKAAFDILKLLTKSHQTRLTVIDDKSGNLLTEETAVIKRWTEHSEELYNYELRHDTIIILCRQTQCADCDNVLLGITCWQI